MLEKKRALRCFSPIPNGLNTEKLKEKLSWGMLDLPSNQYSQFNLILVIGGQIGCTDVNWPPGFENNFNFKTITFCQNRRPLFARIFHA